MASDTDSCDEFAVNNQIVSQHEQNDQNVVYLEDFKIVIQRVLYDNVVAEDISSDEEIDKM